LPNSGNWAASLGQFVVLSKKETIRRDERSNCEIRAEGIDYVEKNLSSNRVMYRLLKTAENGDTRNDDFGVWTAEDFQGNAPGTTANHPG